MISRLLSLFYPLNCWVCKEPLETFEDLVCLSCTHQHQAHLPLKDGESEVDQLFWCKSPIEQTFVPYLFVKDEPLQKLIHDFKYHNFQNLSRYFACQMALKITAKNSGIDAIAYVPMHFKKQKKRGYNQAEVLAKALSKKLKLPINHGLVRITKTTSQTDKSVLDRYDNMFGKFDYTSNQDCQHLLLVDDVITTGATLIACRNAILARNPKIKVSIAAIAYRSIG